MLSIGAFVCIDWLPFLRWFSHLNFLNCPEFSWSDVCENVSATLMPLWSCQPNQARNPIWQHLSCSDPTVSRSGLPRTYTGQRKNNLVQTSEPQLMNSYNLTNCPASSSSVHSPHQLHWLSFHNYYLYRDGRGSIWISKVSGNYRNQESLSLNILI